MLSTTILLVCASSLVAATDALVVSGNAPTIKYRATLPESTTTPIRGAISGHGSNNTEGIMFNANFTGFPVDGGPYIYHIHEKPVPADGNCTGTGGHLDPYLRGEAPPCDDHNPASCQVGDLSGKHGKPLSGTYNLKYRDLFVSNTAGAPAFFGNRSVVVHNKDKVRLTCANFTLVAEPVMNGSCSSATLSAATYSITAGTAAPTTTVDSLTGASASPTTITTGGASVNGLSFVAMLLAGAAFFL